MCSFCGSNLQFSTPITFNNLMVRTSQHSHPVMLGPILVHQTKTFRPFHYFASTLIRLNPLLTNLKCFGTDGEPELIKAFHLCFPKAIHLRCINHLRRNIKDKLRSIGFPQGECKEILHDIFGVQRDDHFEAGLIDAKSEAIFLSALRRLKDRWNNLERSYVSHVSTVQFYDWFSKYKVKDITQCVLPDVRKQAGLDNTQHFTTNASESINNVIKQEVQWKENKLPVLIEHLKAIVLRHTSELEKAVIGRGEWRFLCPYNYLKVPDAKWFSMSHDARELHMRKVYNCPLKSSANSGASTSGSLTLTTSLSVLVEEVNLESISESTLQGIWKKATNILKLKKEQVLEVPWVTNKKTRLVKSSSSPQPHLVTSDSKSQLYCCDDKCVMFKSFHLCSHVVAVAEINGELSFFLKSLQTSTPNLTTIANEGLPSGSGRKGGQVKPKKRTKVNIVSRSVRSCLEEPTFNLNHTNQSGGKETTSNCTSSSMDVSPISPASGISVSLGNSHGQVTVATGASLTIAPVLNTLPSLPPPTANTIPSLLSSIPATGLPLTTSSTGITKPFYLKFLTKQIKVCQSCRSNYEGANDTLGMVVARAERRLIVNPLTGLQFLTKESNSHYHARISCLQLALPSFQSKDLVVTEDY